MKLSLRLLSIPIFLIFLQNVYPQVAQKGVPPSFRYNLKNEVNFYDMPAFDIEAQKVEADAESGTYKTKRYAKAFETDLAIAQYATLDTLDDGAYLFRLGIRSYNAYSIGVTLENYALPEGVAIYLYNLEKTDILGAFTSANNSDSKVLSIAPVKGEAVIMECFVPAGVDFGKQLTVAQVAHDYTNIFEYLDDLQLKSGSCNVDINCKEGLDWQIEKRAVVKMLVNNIELCTGTLVNNSSYDASPYILTANHCVNTSYKAERTVFIFNYENRICGINYAAEKQSLSGSTIKATTPKIDFSLLELNTPPSDSLNIYFAGWRATPEESKSSVCIHHPDGDAKKISIDEEAPETANYGEGYLENSHWLILRWEIGTTEKGSSGSPIFDENHLIIGDLTGGRANCRNSVNDYYSKFSVAWDSFNDTTMQLKHWLDPLDLGITQLGGFDPRNPRYTHDAEAIEFYNIEPLYCKPDTITPVLKFKNNGTEPLKTLSINYQFDDNEWQIFTWNGNLQAYITAEITLPSFTADYGDHRLQIITDSPNQTYDQNPKNDTLTFHFGVKRGVLYQLELLTDKFGNETHWELIADNKDTIYADGEYENNQTYNYNFCLSDDCYLFTIHDKDGDGICCQSGVGSYKISKGIEKSVLMQGGDFTFDESYEFCVSNIADIKPDDINALTFYPNPANQTLNIAYPFTAKHKIEIVNILGKIVFSGQVANTMQTVIDTSKLESGIYLVKISNSVVNISRKIIITHF